MDLAQDVFSGVVESVAQSSESTPRKSQSLDDVTEDLRADAGVGVWPDGSLPARGTGEKLAQVSPQSLEPLWNPSQPL